MTRLQQLYTQQQQSPWLDNLTRAYLRDGTLADFVADGIRGVTANPTIFANAIEGSDAYDEQFGALIADGYGVEDAYWELAVRDVDDALAVLRPTYDRFGGRDGFVSIEVAPGLARDTQATIAAANMQRPLWASISTKNPDYPETRYIDDLIGPDSVSTMTESTIAAFEDHGTVARTVDGGIAAAETIMGDLKTVAIDMDDVGHTLEQGGIAGFDRSFAHLLDTLHGKAHQHAQR
jgi:transaldolase